MILWPSGIFVYVDIDFPLIIGLSLKIGNDLRENGINKGKHLPTRADAFS